MSTITRIKCKTDNCYLISEGRNAILVDTGSSQCLDLVIAECDKYDLKLIVLTHVHFDHAENAAELSRRYGVPYRLLFISLTKNSLKALTGSLSNVMDSPAA